MEREFNTGVGAKTAQRYAYKIINMSEEEAAFWEKVRKTHAEVRGKQYRPCASRMALLKWYNKLHTDSAEYRMWGNGMALPCALYVMEGIAIEMQTEAKEKET